MRMGVCRVVVIRRHPLYARPEIPLDLAHVLVHKGRAVKMRELGKLGKTHDHGKTMVIALEGLGKALWIAGTGSVQRGFALVTSLALLQVPDLEAFRFWPGGIDFHHHGLTPRCQRPRYCAA